MPAVNFDLSCFSSDLQMSQLATLPSNTNVINSTEYDAIACFQVNIADMMNVFNFQVDTVDVNNANPSSFRYYVRMDNWPENLVLNPAQAEIKDNLGLNGIDISDPNIPSDKFKVKHDFLRYIAQKLFNTSKGVELLSNTTELLENMVSLGSEVYPGSTFNNIKNILSNISTTGTNANLMTDGQGLKYLPDTYTTNGNVCREIMTQMFTLAASRMSTLPSGQSDSYMYQIPFLEGDVLEFITTLHVASGQEELTSVAAISPRRYLMKIELVSAPSNIAVNDTYLVSDTPYSNFTSAAIPFTTVDNGTTGGESLPQISPPDQYSNIQGWYYANDITQTSKKINWYVAAPTNSTVADLGCVYYTAILDSVISVPFLTVYTKIDGGVNASSWYKSRKTFALSAGNLTDLQNSANANVQVGVNFSGSSLVSSEIDGYYLAVLENIDATANKGDFGASEEILFISISTNSVEPESNNVKLLITSCAVVTTAVGVQNLEYCFMKQ